ncbi:peptidyl-prolyl cis-trans isomerase FKBP53-like [Silene latifolia]|uniref:peptidyl-prolyl cis-trans isomerase FKBP53-like n=1 Tax=Silene latifolia TaxID=37657 RepID=UPI003D77F8B9
MTFWGVEVKPGKPFTLNGEELGGPLILTQATLGLGSSSKKSTLQVNVGDKKPIFLCTLLPGKSECFSLNLEFDEEEDVNFSVEGPTSIHLSGYVQRPQHDDEDCELDCCGEDIAETESEDSEFESEDDYENDFINDDDMPMHPPPARNKGVVIEEIEDDDDEPVSKKSGKKQVKKKKELPTSTDDGKAQLQVVVKGNTGDIELESEDEDGFPISSSGHDKSRFSELQASTGSKTADKLKTKKKEDDVESATNLKRKIDAMDQDQEPKSEGDDAIDGDASEDKKKKKKNKKKKKAKVEIDETVANTNQNAGEVANVKKGDKVEKKTPEAVKDTKQSKDKPAKARTYSNGLIVEEIEMGNPTGKRASPGKKISVRYIGKLKKTGEIFDSNIGRSPLKFRLGVGQVIKGWDVGVEGMRVGDKRRLTIPPAMGYGPEGSQPGIPPNAWLVFDVELVDVA